MEQSNRLKNEQNKGAIYCQEDQIHTHTQTQTREQYQQQKSFF